jgi:hypothetical protein
VQGADEEDIYFDLYDEILADICRITRCGDDRLIICPGNHDADRSIVAKHAREQKELLARLQDRDELNAAFLDGELDQLISDKFGNFESLRGLLSNHTQRTALNSFITLYKPSDYAAEFVVLNSAAMTWAGVDHISDERHLLVPEACLKDISKQLDRGRAQILISHHPMNWLTSGCEADLATSLDGLVQYHLFGHLHQAAPQQVTMMKGSCLSNQSGALYEARSDSVYNGYSIVSCDVESGNSAVHYRSYFDKRRAFDAGVNVTKDGVFYPNPQSRAFWYKLGKKIDRVGLRKWLVDSVLPAAQQTFNEGLVERPLCDVFVPPPLYTKRVPADVGDDDVSVEISEPTTLAEIVSGTNNIIFSGREEYGKTTLLRQTALLLLEQARNDANSISLPIVIDFGSARTGQNRMNSLLRGAIYTDIETYNLGQLLEEGLVTILVDDVDFNDAPRMKILRTFMRQNSRNRFIFSTTSDVSRTLALGDNIVANTETSLSFDTIFLAPFTRQKMRTFVAKWDKEGRLDHEKVLNRIIREFASINMPITAVNGTILLSIYDDLNEATLINRAVLIERFVEFLLEKPALSDVQRSAVDFKIKEHILAHVAGSMARADKYILSRMELYEVVKEHLTKFGFAWDPDDIIDMFIKSRVLSKHPDGRISFRYRAFLEYFVAKQMMEDGGFNSWLLEEDRYLMFSNELLYYSGLIRNDASLLELVGERFEKANQQAINDLQWMPDIRKIDEFTPPLATSEEDLFEEFERQMDLPPMTPDERDEILEGEIPVDSGARQQVYRPTISHIGHRWTMALLLYSGLLKNMELISDGDKRRHLAAILKSWGLLAGMSLAVVPTLAKHREFKVNGVLYKINYPTRFNEAKIARSLYIDMPNCVGRLLLSVLGTEKLEKQLAEPALDEANEPSIVTYYRHSLIADMKLRSWVTGLERLYNRIRHSAYLTEVFLRKTTALYMIGDAAEKDSRDLKEVVGKVIAISRTKGGKERARRKARAMQNLEKRLLVYQTKVIAQELAPGDENQATKLQRQRPTNSLAIDTKPKR